MNTVCKVPDLCWSPRPAAAAVFVDAVNGLQTFFLNLEIYHQRLRKEVWKHYLTASHVFTGLFGNLLMFKNSHETLFFFL